MPVFLAIQYLTVTRTALVESSDAQLVMDEIGELSDSDEDEMDWRETKRTLNDYDVFELPEDQLKTAVCKLLTSKGK